MRTFAKIIGYGLVLLLLAAAIGFTCKFTNGFNEDFKTFYVEYQIIIFSGNSIKCCVLSIDHLIDRYAVLILYRDVISAYPNTVTFSQKIIVCPLQYQR